LLLNEETGVVRQKASCFSVLRSFRHSNEQGNAVFLRGKDSQQRNGVGDEDLLTEEDVISGGLATKLWPDRLSHPVPASSQDKS
jgi:hypothetical protein